VKGYPYSVSTQDQEMSVIPRAEDYDPTVTRRVSKMVMYTPTSRGMCKLQSDYDASWPQAQIKIEFTLRLRILLEAHVEPFATERHAVYALA
jgi:hypothetical protein